VVGNTASCQSLNPTQPTCQTCPTVVAVADVQAISQLFTCLPEQQHIQPVSPVCSQLRMWHSSASFRTKSKSSRPDTLFKSKSQKNLKPIGKDEQAARGGSMPCRAAPSSNTKLTPEMQAFVGSALSLMILQHSLDEAAAAAQQVRAPGTTIQDSWTEQPSDLLSRHHLSIHNHNSNLSWPALEPTAAENRGAPLTPCSCCRCSYHNHNACRRRQQPRVPHHRLHRQQPCASARAHEVDAACGTLSRWRHCEGKSGSTWGAGGVLARSQRGCSGEAGVSSAILRLLNAAVGL
jgi:hypothetical protein